jgi:microcystin-dependent protein
MSLRFELDKRIRRITGSTPVNTNRPDTVVDKVPIGSVFPFASVRPPYNYLICDGSEVSRSKYNALFNVIKTRYGAGDNSTTFNLPDLRLKFPLGATGSPYTSTSGTTGGSFTSPIGITHLPPHGHTGTVDSAGGHTHGINDPGHGHTYLFPGTQNAASGADTVAENNIGSALPQPTTTSTTGITTQTAGDHVHTFTSTNTGGGTPLPVTNPYLSLHYIIKYKH